MNHLAPAAGLAACSLVCAQDSETTERRELGRTFLHQQSGDAARAISGGIRWLVAHQDTDGGWSAAEFMHVEEPSRGVMVRDRRSTTSG